MLNKSNRVIAHYNRRDLPTSKVMTQTPQVRTQMSPATQSSLLTLTPGAAAVEDGRRKTASYQPERQRESPYVKKRGWLSRNWGWFGNRRPWGSWILRSQAGLVARDRLGLNCLQRWHHQPCSKSPRCLFLSRGN